MRMSVNMGYYESWAKNRFGCNPIQPGEIDVAAFGYTREFYCLLSGQISISNSELVFRSAYKDLAFSFAGISWEGKLEPYNGDKSYINQYMSFNALKTSNRGLKTLIAVGGW
jgi:GH18 family chitinase